MADDVVLAWQIDEYEFREKHPRWFWYVGIITAVLALGSILFKNFLLAIFLLISGFAITLYGVRRPQQLSCALTQRGLRLGKQLFLFTELKSFWVNDHDEPSGGRLIFESKKLLMPHLIIPLDGAIDSDELRAHLQNLLPEKKHDDNLFDVLGDYLGF